MCFDPVSLALIAGGTVASSAGSGMDAKANSKFIRRNVAADTAEMQQNYDEMLARNAVRDRYVTANEGLIAENQGNLGDVIAKFGAAPQGTRLADAGADRGNNISAAINFSQPLRVAMREGAPSVVKDTLDQRLGDVFTNAHESGGRLAKVGAYGDAMGANKRDIGSTQQKVDTTNTISKGMMANLGHEQDLAGFQVRKPIFRPAGPEMNPWADVLKSLGSMMGAAGGSGKFSPGGTTQQVGTMQNGQFVRTPYDPWAGLRM